MMDGEYWKIILVFAFVVLASVVFKEYRKQIYGAGIYHAASWFFDNPIWIAVELKWGWRGVMGMVIAAIIVNTCLLVYYRNKKASWVLWDALHAEKEKEEIYRERHLNWQRKKNLPNAFFLFMAYISAQMFAFMQKCLKVKKVGGGIVFVGLSIFEDPFIATTFIRHGREKINGINKKDAAIFITSLVISIGYWAIRNGLITEIVIRPIYRVI